MKLTQTNSPVQRAMTLTAAVLAYEATECALLERLIAVLQLNNRDWLHAHPEHAEAFVDAFYERRSEAEDLANGFSGNPDGFSVDPFATNGLWALLYQRHESRQALDQRFAAAGFMTLDLDEWFSPEERDEIEREAAEMTRFNQLEADSDRFLDHTDGYLFGLPDGWFTLHISRRYADAIARLHDLAVARGRFPGTEWQVFSDDLLTSGEISHEERASLHRWIAFKCLPTASQDAQPVAPLITGQDHRAALDRIRHLFSDCDSGDEVLPDSHDNQQAAEIAAQVIRSARKDDV